MRCGTNQRSRPRRVAECDAGVRRTGRPAKVASKGLTDLGGAWSAKSGLASGRSERAQVREVRVAGARESRRRMSELISLFRTCVGALKYAPQTHRDASRPHHRARPNTIVAMTRRRS